jgi:hypothetical protein
MCYVPLFQTAEGNIFSAATYFTSEARLFYQENIKVSEGNASRETD